MQARHAVYPLLFAVQPVLLLYAANSTEVRFGAVMQPLMISAGCAAALVLTLLAFMRDIVRAALVASVLIIGFFSLGRAASAPAFTDLPVDSRVAASVVWGIVVATLAVVLVRTRRRLERVGSGAGLVALVLTAVPLVQLGVRWAAAPRETVATHTAPHEPTAKTQGQRSRSTLGVAARMPDIYYIVLDGYARSDVMQQIYGFDNTAFLDRLRRRGFQVASQSRANYCKTLHALASTLNMQYLHELAPVARTAVDSKPLIDLVRSNRAVHLLREHGYSIVAFASGYDLVEFSKIDHYLDSGGGWGEFTSMLVATTPVAWILDEERDLHAQHRQRLEYILDKISRVREGSPPRFVFAHLLAPHPPFVFDRDGKPVAVQRAFGFYDGSDYVKHGGTVTEYIAGYAEQARWVTERLERALDALLERYGESPPIIILQSDHGPGSGLDWKSVPDTDLKERFGILMAAYLPGEPAVDLSEAFSPVNTFRLVFDVYFGADMRPLEHRSFYTFQSLPFRYIDVTDPQEPHDLRTP